MSLFFCFPRTAPSRRATFTGVVSFSLQSPNHALKNGDLTPISLKYLFANASVFRISSDVNSFTLFLPILCIASISFLLILNCASPSHASISCAKSAFSSFAFFAFSKAAANAVFPSADAIYANFELLTILFFCVIVNLSEEPSTYFILCGIALLLRVPLNVGGSSAFIF